MEFHMKNEVLGLPPPLEFEEPQMGNTDWSGFGLNSNPTKQQNTHLSLGTIPSQAQTIQPRFQTIKVTKVCKVCGIVLNTPAEAAKHLNCMLWKCGKCQFQTKTLATFNEHLKLHQMKHSCTLCHEAFSSPITHAVHKRKIHDLYDCKYCFREFTSKTEWSNHIKLTHGNKRNVTLPSSEGPFSNEMLLPKFPILVPGPPAGLIISASEAMNTVCGTNVQQAPVLFNNPQLLGHRNPTEKQPLTPNDVQGITCKEEPLETENSNPGTVLVKLKSKRRRRSTSTSKVVAVPCELCPAVFKTLTALRIHTKQKHTEKPKCPACNITRSTSRKIFQHQITAHKEKLRCRHYCLALFDTREELSAHHISVHNKDDTVMKCRHCGKNYPRGTYLEHLQDCIGEIKCKRVKTCPTCDRKFVDPTDYNHHIRTCESSSIKDDGENESPTASTSAENNQEEKQNLTNQLELDKMLEESSKSSEENQKLKEDKDSQLKTNQFKCRFCSKVFQCKDDGVDHMVNQHNTAFSCMKEYRVCDICGKLFISGLSLCKHVLRHYERGNMWKKILPANFGLEDIKVKCWVCKTSGVSHSKFHTKSRNLVIENLLSGKTSKITATDEDCTFNCNLCEETFTDIHKFWNHIKIHITTPSVDNAKDPKHFLCPKCPQKYAVQSELLEHLALHLIQQNIPDDKLEKPASNNMFTNSIDKMGRDLNEGESLDESDSTKLKTDVSDNPVGTYKCLYCEQVSSIKSDALNHLLSKHVDNLNVMINGKTCNHCEQSFVKSYALCSHILKHYIDLGKWEDMVPRNLLSKVNRQFCWICKTALKTGHSAHMIRRNNTIEEALSCRTEELEEDEQFQCPLCDFSCSNRYSHWKHIKLHLFLNRRSLGHVDTNSEVEQSTVLQDSQHKKFNCLKCNEQFSEILSFRRHLACHFLSPFKVKKRKRNEDDSDDKHVSKKRKTMTLRSKSLRSNSGIVRCTRCFMTFESTNEGVSHVLHAHKFKMTNVKEQALTCKMCGSKFKGAWWLCRHIVNHYCNLQMWNDLVPRDMVNALNTRNQCWICKCVLDKNYVGHTSKRNAYIGMLLTEHCKEEESKFDCSLCNQEFSTRNEFWQHMKLHLSKPSSDYTTQSDLIQKEKKENYECSDCSLHFKSENELYKHLAFHFLEYTNKGKLETDIMVEDHQSEETVQTEESSEDDEWLPPSIVKKRKAENKKLEESNDSVIKIEDHEILEDISEITIKSEDIGIDEM
ncbi:zinc finger protein Xfin-like isoform X2 [Portunus trituberculatus]|uniref:zinc finger protein Xfin-like isoform X2 n=1 Tax=Portunus trituberculatus TaxID=210409 RepID=UPI001E1CC2C0|nr:zinc finger protein Xfin-like isoform X2 [Portunus trituberculatus]